MNYTKTNRLNARIISRLDSLNSGAYVPFYIKECSAGYHAFHYLTEHNCLVSFVGIMPVNENSVELTAYTFPSYRHQGHFTFLLENVMKELTKASCCHIFSEQMLDFPFIKNIPSHAEYLMQLTYRDYTAVSKPAAFDTKLLEYHCETESVYVLTEGKNAVGLLKLTCEKNSKTACIHHVQIRKKYRHKGYGTLLVSHTLDSFLQKKNCDMVLHVTSTNTAAVHLYQKLGFRIIQSLDYYRLELQCSQ